MSAVGLSAPSARLGEAWPERLSVFAGGSLLLQTVLGAFASDRAWMWLLGRYPATRISVFVFLTSLFALLFGALWWASRPRRTCWPPWRWWRPASCR